MSTNGEDELDDLIGEWADAASEDADDLDSLADAWASSDRARKLSDAPYVPPPPGPDEPIELPKRPDPVVLPPLPSGDFVAAAKKGDTRYASPIEIATPAPINLPKQTPGVAAASAGKPSAPKAPPVPKRAAPPLPPKPTLAAPKAQAPRPKPAAPPLPPKPSLPAKPVEAPKPKAAATRTIHDYLDNEEESAWQRLLPFGLLALGALALLAIAAMFGNGDSDDTGEPLVIDQPELTDAGALKPAEPTARETPARTEPPRAQDPIKSKPAEPIPDPQLSKPAPKPVPKPETPEPVQVKSDTVKTPIEISNDDISKEDVFSAAPPRKTESADLAKPTLEADAPANAPPSLKPETVKSRIVKPAPSSSSTTPLRTTTVSTAPSSSTRTTVTRTTTSTPSTTRRIYTTTQPTTTNQTRASAFSPSINNVIARPQNARPQTVADLLHEKAAEGARNISEPQSTSSFNAAIKRAMDYTQDGGIRALTTPDGRLLALKVEGTQKEQVRSVLIPRAREVSELPSNLVLENSAYRTNSRIGLRARPSEGPATKSLERGERIESIGIIEDTDWRLVAQNGRAIGYLKSSEIQSTNISSAYPVQIEDAKSTAFDVTRAKTTCRTIQYAIDDDGASGSFTACRAYGGEWVLENGGDTPPLSPGQYVFRE